jgi:phosphohistidine phosphatase
MRIYFLRHGVADAREAWTGPDEERPLTEQGMAEMRQVACGMRVLKLRLGEVVTSPLVRARQTAEIVASKLKLEMHEEPALAAGCTFPALVQVIGAHAPAGTDVKAGLLLVGHEPDFSTAVRSLIEKNGNASVALAKGGLCRVDLEVDTTTEDFAWDSKHLRDCGTLAWLLTPKLLARIGK